jgi:TDG/mug DNA glycosylase family protein
LRRYQPAVACFHGRTAWEHFQRGVLRDVPSAFALGAQPHERRHFGPTRCFVIPNPSGANAHYSVRDLTSWYDRLDDFLSEIGALERGVGALKFRTGEPPVLR